MSATTKNGKKSNDGKGIPVSAPIQKDKGADGQAPAQPQTPPRPTAQSTVVTPGSREYAVAERKRKGKFATQPIAGWILIAYTNFYPTMIFFNECYKYRNSRQPPGHY